MKHVRACLSSLSLYPKRASRHKPSRNSERKFRQHVSSFGHHVSYVADDVSAVFPKPRAHTTETQIETCALLPKELTVFFGRDDGGVSGCHTSSSLRSRKKRGVRQSGARARVSRLTFEHKGRRKVDGNWPRQLAKGMSLKQETKAGRTPDVSRAVTRQWTACWLIHR